jgi:hypothetical protein
MPSFQTIYRATVMIAVGVIVAKGWRLYGPSAEQVKSAIASAADKAETAWKNWQKPAETPRAAADTQGTAPAFANATQQPAVAPVAPLVSAPPSAPFLPQAPQVPSTNMQMGAPPASLVPTGQPPVTSAVKQVSQESTVSEDRVPALLSRLERLGAADPKVAPWGSSGHLFRCDCRAAMADSPALSEHFESVASEPALAVEQVVAKVEAWRGARSNDSNLR